MIIDNKEWLFSGIGSNLINNLFEKKNKDSKVINSYINNVVNNNMIINDKSKDDEKNEVFQLVDNFKKIYIYHGVSIKRIPFFVDKKFGLNLIDFKDEESILRILDENLINWTCNTFGVEKKWLYGESNKMYKYNNYYKSISRFINDMYVLKQKYNSDLKLYMFKNGELSREDIFEKYITIVVECPIKKLDDNIIFKYIPIYTNWDWGYWRTRYQLKSIICICEKLGIDIEAYDMEIDNMYKISGGLICPKLEIDRIKTSRVWYPADYITDGCSGKEIDELEEVKKYIKDEGYLKYLEKINNRNL